MVPSALFIRTPWHRRLGLGLLSVVVVAAVAWLVTGAPGPAARGSTPSEELGARVALPNAAAASATPPGVRPNIVLLTIDTLRADHVSSYGYGRNTTPFIDSLASNGVRFERAYATSSWTVPSVASMVTGLHPGQHGVTRGVVVDSNVVAQRALPLAAKTLAERLSVAGYSTFGITANGHLATELGFHRGFDLYECLGFATAGRVKRRVRQLAPIVRRETAPLFVWIHLFDPHAPYRAREPWLTEFWPVGLPRHPKLETLGVVGAGGEFVFDDEKRGYLEALYDGEIRHTDRAVEEIARMLGGLDDAIWVIGSDHGEELGDHGGYGHGRTLYEETIRVPLMVRAPGIADAGRVVDQAVSLIDLMPTLMELAGIDPDLGLPGRSLVPLLHGSVFEDSPAFADLTQGAHQRAVLSESFKLIDDGIRHPRLFDLVDDPRERHDLAFDDPAHAFGLYTMLAAHAEATSVVARPLQSRAMGDDEIARLRALGYVTD